MEFLTVTVRDGSNPIVEPAHRRKARSQLMKAYKRQQREKQAVTNPTSEHDDLAQDAGAMLAGDEAWRAHRNARKPQTASRKAGGKVQTSDAGSHERQTISTSSKPADLQDSAERAAALRLTKLLGIAPTNSYRLALIAAMANDAFPPNIPVSSPGNYIVAAWAEPHSLAMQAGADAFALLSLAGSTGNRDFVLESRRRYLAATMCLRQEVKQADFDYDSVMGAAQMTMAWNAHGAHEEEGIDWKDHAAGMAAIMKANTLRRKTATIHPNLLTNARHALLMKAWIQRERLPLASHVLMGDMGALKKGGYQALMWLALDVSQWLACARERKSGGRNMFSAGHDEEIHVRLIEDRRALINWLDDHHRLRKSCSVLKLLNAASSDSWRKTTPPFSSFLDALYHNFYWNCQLLITEALLDLAESQDSDTKEEKTYLVKQADEYAARLLKLIPFLWENAGGMTGKAQAVRANFHFLIEWYTRIGDEGQSQTCKEMERDFVKHGRYFQWRQNLLWAHLSLGWLAS